MPAPTATTTGDDAENGSALTGLSRYLTYRDLTSWPRISPPHGELDTAGTAAEGGAAESPRCGPVGHRERRRSRTR